MKNLEKIAVKFQPYQSVDADNYGVGGGLTGYKFASRRHEDANDDPSKVTLGAAVQMFKRATGMPSPTIKAIIVKHLGAAMEWHHAGKLPKAYGGGMKKTYFVNAAQMIEIALSWDALVAELADREDLKKELSAEKIKIESMKTVERFDDLVGAAPKFSVITYKYMEGKYGRFTPRYDTEYNLPLYKCGYAFKTNKTKEKYQDVLRKLKDL